MTSTLQKLKGKIYIKEESGVSLSFGFYMKVVKKVVEGILSGDRL